MSTDGFALPSLNELRESARVVSLPMAARFRGIEVREALLLRGPAGWTEFSPFADKDRAADEEQLGMTTAVIDGLLAEIADPAVPFDPGLVRRGACEDCSFAAICGRL